MKNKIYYQLFKYVDPKSWTKTEDSDGNTIYNSYYYPDYKLEFNNKGIYWSYKVKKDGDTIHKSIITFNIGGKIVFTVAIALLTVFILTFTNQDLIIKYPHNIFYLAGLYLLSYIILSIFHFRFYLAFRKARYYIKNAKKIQEKEENIVLQKQVTEAINRKIGTDTKLARKIKLKELNKKRFSFFGKKDKKEE